MWLEDAQVCRLQYPLVNYHIYIYIYTQDMESPPSKSIYNPFTQLLNLPPSFYRLAVFSIRLLLIIKSKPNCLIFFTSSDPTLANCFDQVSDIVSAILSGLCSDILSGIYSDIFSGILSGILSGIVWHSIWHLFKHSFWHSFWHLFWHSIWHSLWHSI